MKDKRKQSSARNVWDLRSAIRLRERTSGQLLTTVTRCIPREHWQGFTSPSEPGPRLFHPPHPARLFRNLKGYKNIQVIAGVMANRDRTALLLGTTSRGLPYLL